MRQLYLVRHPAPAIAAGICYGATDLVPGHDSLAQACATLRPQLPPNLPMYSSPLQRCALLAHALHASPRLDARLAEINFGRWEMRAWEEIPRTELDAWAAAPLTYAGHGGEAVVQLQQRVSQFLHALPEGDAVLITHGGVIKCMLAQILGLAEEEWLPLHFAYASVTRVTMADDGRSHRLWHNSAHD